ncbi:ion transporter [Pandoraea sp.]|uniref:ion transporter n=1 Tax=Pandoraea sp. TaxID=1883445 RepID=UPI001204E63B|nr:ion transporter [Pandoraea sp.]TAL56609.1 MAG: ion transporter [Pandoraea sp.]TAM15430.1 MAG: ion transporter [Pandoraea sp.]
MQGWSDQPTYGWRKRLYTIIFEADTTAGRRFDEVLLVAICASVLVVVLGSVPAIQARASTLLWLLEWLFTLAFTVEYVARLACVRHPWRYALSLYGLVDLASILPTYLAILVPELYYLIDVRLLRLMRVFRILRLSAYVSEASVLREALYHARRKIFVFLIFVSIVVIIIGTLMTIIEGPAHGFTSIPVGIYWAIVTLSTTGYGDLVPRTPLGQAITACVILLGYGVIAIPTGIMGAEISASMRRRPVTTRTCTHCMTEGHDLDARFCKHCGQALSPHQFDEHAIRSR